MIKWLECLIFGCQPIITVLIESFYMATYNCYALINYRVVGGIWFNHFRVDHSTLDRSGHKIEVISHSCGTIK